MHPSRWKETALAALAGVLLALAMPGFGIWPLAFVGLVPFLFAQGTSARVLPGAVCGAVLFAIDLRWLLTLTRFTPLVILGYLVLVALLALALGLVGALVGASRRRFGVAAAWLLVAPIAWSAFELLRAQGEIGLSFSALYSALHRVPALIQGVSLLGPWALTAAVVFINGALAQLLIRRPRGLLAGAGVAALLATLWWLPLPPAGEAMEVGIVGSDVAQDVKLAGTELATLTPFYLDMGRRAASEGPQLIVFPESILPAFILRDEGLLKAFSDLAREAGSAILFGTGDYMDGEILNRVALLSEAGELVGTYAMMHPVPFGETVPGRRILEALGLATWILRMLPVDLTPGKEYTILDGIGAPICFESTFPAISRRFAEEGATLLVTVTNDAWFDGSSELRAHFAAAVFRAVETRRYVIQAANGGISGIVDPRGRIVAQRVGETVLAGRVEHRSGASAYVRYGELPLLVLFVLLLVGGAAWRRLA
ncbi:MAG: apolipoprotein N-acyltransferase [Candidatus Bipolaricaulota bacterium]|nr:MAG: apolipoprotein N-acyltransferase [Candidatus Bipolaricaulota bacterium]